MFWPIESVMVNSYLLLILVLSISLSRNCLSQEIIDKHDCTSSNRQVCASSNDLHQRIDNLLSRMEEEEKGKDELKRDIGILKDTITSLQNISSQLQKQQLSRDLQFRELEENLSNLQEHIKNGSIQELPNTTPVTMTTTDSKMPSKVLPTDCSDILNNTSGIYAINITGVAEPVSVYCDMDRDQGSWIVFQRRQDGSVDFYRGWDDYKEGFRNLSGEFWLGNRFIHKLTSQGTYELRIDLADFDGEKKYAKYNSFSVGDDASNYELEVSGYSGNAGDSFSFNNGSPFTTLDRDNDRKSHGNCAVLFKGAWWYQFCGFSNLNGQYLGGTQKTHADGVNWYGWRGYTYSYKFTQMSIRRRQHIVFV